MNSTKQKRLLLIPLALFIGFVPLIVHAKYYDSGLQVFDWFERSGQEADFFTYYKSVAITVLGLIMLAVFLYKAFVKKEKLKLTTDFAFLGAYVALAMLSGLFSKYRHWAIFGSYDIFETIWCLLAYGVVIVYALHLIEDEDDVKFVLKIAVIGYTLVTLIGFFQYLGLDFYRSSIGKHLIMPTSTWDGLDSLSFTFPLGTSYTSLYNSNYLALYYGLSIPLIVVLIFTVKKLWVRIALVVLFLLSFISLVGSNSKTGMITLVIVAVFAVIVLFETIKEHKLIILVIAAVAVAAVVMISARYGGFTPILNMLTGSNSSYLPEEDYHVKNIITADDEVVFVTANDELHITYDIVDEEYVYTYFKDQNGTDIAYSYGNEGEIIPNDPENRFYGCYVIPQYLEDYIGITVTFDGIDWYFTNQVDGTYMFYNDFGKFTKMRNIPVSHVFNEGFSNGRGHIWNRCLPLLKKYIFLGSGANTFVMAYPNDDYINKKYLGTNTVVDVKAHSFYFGNLVENGIIATLSIVIFYLIYFVKSFKIYRKRQKIDWLYGTGLGIYLGSVAYMISSITNDSNVSTAPFYWGILGLGFAVNHIISERKTNE
ncbi:MAG: O-antigen ligase family protein [Lachnospiraceae bacterium]|nr:O-antigen ligase family protein [Lachnospiraceae bacterium]